MSEAREKRLKELAGLLAKRTDELREGDATKPRLRLVGGKDLVLRGENASQREALIYRIRDFAIMYRLAWYVRQETAHYGKSLTELSEEQLGEVMKGLERGLDCRTDGIAFVDAGLVRGSMGDEMGY